MPEFKPLPALKPLRGLKLKIEHVRIALPDPIGGDHVLNLEDPTVHEIFIRLGHRPKDYKLAQRVARWMEKYPQGTIPELVTLDYLETHGISYTYQAWVAGGRSRRGGVVPDFVVDVNGMGMAWNVNGEYWHTRPEVVESDAIDRLTLLGRYFEHVLIERVINLWENDIYFRRPQVFEMALVGIGMRGDGIAQ